MSPFHFFLPFSLSQFHKTFSSSFFIFTMFYIETIFPIFPIYLCACLLLVSWDLLFILSATGLALEERKGMTERNDHELTIILSSCTTWFLAEKTIRTVATVRGEDRRLGWRTEHGTGRRERTGKDLTFVFLFPITQI